MQAHLEQWWGGVKDDVMVPQRVVIGHDAENPLMLTACEWLDVFVDQQRQIRQADLKNGAWHLTVDRAGTYKFELRRWPRETELRLRSAIPATRVTDGTYLAGKGLPIAAATIELGTDRRQLEADSGQKSFTAVFELEAGPIELRTTFLDDQGKPLCGAYYVYVERL
jgi:hypothetical protein